MSELRREPQWYRSGRAQGNGDGERYWTRWSLQVEGADDARSCQGRLEHGEILTDAGSCAATKGQICVTVAILFRCCGKAVGIEALRCLPYSWMVVGDQGLTSTSAPGGMQ